MRIRLCSENVLIFISVLLITIFLSIQTSSQVLGLPPPPPSGPGAPPDENICVATNGGVEICDSIDNDCNGSFDEGVCTTESNSTDNSTESPVETTTESGASTSTSSGSKGSGGGGGGSSGGSSGVIYFPTTTTSNNNNEPSTNTDLETNSEHNSENTEDSLILGSDSQSSNDNSVDSSISNIESNRGNILLLQEFVSSNYRAFLIGSSIILILTLIGIFIFVKIRHNSKSLINGSNTNSNNFNQKESAASKYITQMRTNNYSENDIRASMKKSGWSDEEINKLTKK